MLSAFWGLTPWGGSASRAFVSYDDHANFVEKRHLLYSSSWSSVQWCFQATVLGVYEPVALLFKKALFLVGGFSVGPWLVGTGVILHVANTVGIYVLATQLSRWVGGTARNRGTAWASDYLGGSCAGALLYGVHPLRVEVVAWASCLPYLLASFFSLGLAVLRTQRCVSDHAWRLWFLESGAFLLAVLSKTTAVGVAPALVWLDWAFQRNKKGRALSVLDVLRLNAHLLGIAVLAAALALGANAEGGLAAQADPDHSILAGPRIATVVAFKLLRATAAVWW